MRLGIDLGYWGVGLNTDNLTIAKEAERLGYAVCWVPEAYGTDAATVLAWVVAHTERIDIGSAILQIPARSPAMAAVTAATLDSLSGGRFRLGLGVSGPQVSEGWYGVRFDQPLARTREYVQMIRTTLDRACITQHDKCVPLLPPSGPGKAPGLAVPSVRERLPLYIAAIGPRNLEQTGEIADGALLLFAAAEHLKTVTVRHIQAGREKIRQTMDGFDVCPTLPLALGDSPDALANTFRPYVALYLGGMGSQRHNFYNQLARRMGYEKEAVQIQERYLSGDKSGAEAMVPLSLIDSISLLGPVERIADRMRAYADAGVTTLTVAPAGWGLHERLAGLRAAVNALEHAGLN